jgi:hypothetical protein
MGYRDAYDMGLVLARNVQYGEEPGLAKTIQG